MIVEFAMAGFHPEASNDLPAASFRGFKDRTLDSTGPYFIISCEVYLLGRRSHVEECLCQLLGLYIGVHTDS